MKIESRIETMLKVMSDGIYEKEHILAMTLLSAIAGESIFLLGPPGTAKSLVSRRLKMAFKDAKAFEYLMSRFSTPDEIFGPVSISLLKNEDRYERVVDGFLPTATIVFLDEIWKAGPSIQNALLTAINERIFQNGRNTLFLPMKALIAASNDLPAEDEGLEALWDRFLVRMVSNCIQTESTFFKMIRQKPTKGIAMPEELQITDDIYETWQQEIQDVAIPDNVCAVVSAIRKRLKEEASKEGNKVMDYYVSDRRWKKCFHIMQTAAFLNGRKSIDETDIPILFHCLWNTAETIPTVIDIIADALTDELYKKMNKIEKDIDQALKQVSKTNKEMEEARADDEEYKEYNYFYWKILKYPVGNCLFYKYDYSHIVKNKDYNGIIYWDGEKNVWMVHAIFTGTPFDSKLKKVSNVRTISLRKCDGGIIIDGTPYGFERVVPSNQSVRLDESILPATNAADVAIETLRNDLKPSMQKIQNNFATRHLFLSEDDRKIVQKHLAKCEKRTQELEVKITNAQQLL
jgi:MoxR-like ATPase